MSIMDTKTQARYRVVASRKSGIAEGPSGVEFLVTSDGYKQAWVDGRNATRQGGEFKNEKGESVEVKAGLFTVREVFTLDKRAGGSSKSKVISATDFIAAAQKAGLDLPKKLKALAEEMGVMPAPEQAAEGEQASGEQAAA